MPLAVPYGSKNNISANFQSKVRFSFKSGPYLTLPTSSITAFNVQLDPTIYEILETENNNTNKMIK